MKKPESTLAGRVRTLALILAGLTTTGCGLLTSDEAEVTMTVEAYEFRYVEQSGVVRASVDFVVRNTGDRPVFLNLDLHPCNGGPLLQRRESEGWTYVEPVALCAGPGPGLRLQLLDPDGVFVGALSDSFYPGRPSPGETSEGGPNLLVDGAYRLVWGVALSAEPGADDEGLPLFSNSFVVSLVP